MVTERFKKIINDFREIFKGEHRNTTYSYVGSVILVVFLIGLFRTYRSMTFREITHITNLIRKVDHHAQITDELNKTLTRMQLASSLDTFISNQKRFIQSYEKIYIPHIKELSNFIEDKDIDCDEVCMNILEAEVATMKPFQYKAETSAVIEPIIERFYLESKDSLEVAERLEKRIHYKIQRMEEIDLYFTIIIILLLIMEFILVFVPSITRFTKAITIRSEFLSRISHEIRNPMNAIIGMGDVLSQTELTEEQTQYVGNINIAGQSLLRMLDSLIDFSALNSGKLKLKKSFISLQVIVDRSIHTTSITAHQKGIELLLISNSSLDFKVETDGDKLEQVLVNLLSNAIKFTSKGYVRLVINVEENTAEDIRVKFEVIDTGIGVPESKQKDIFQSFVQADSGIKRQYGGSGLGLTISSEIIRKMKGTLALQSEEGVGSNFFFELKLKVKDMQQVIESFFPSEPPTQKDSLFICHEDMIPCYREIFETTQMTVIGHEKFKGIGRDTKWVFIDDSIGIIEATEIIRELEVDKKNIIIMLKSCFSKENVELLRKSGVEQFIIKPLKPWELRSNLLEKIGERKLKQDKTDTHVDILKLSSLKDKQIKILIVDDAEENLFLLREFLQPVSNNITSASNGQEGVEYFAKEKFDLVLMDLQMPIMDGYTAVREMTKIERKNGWQVPKFAVTAHVSEFERRQCLQAGFNDRIIKPIKQARIIALVADIFTTSEKRDDIDKDIFNQDIIQKLMPKYLQARANDISLMKELIKEKNFKELKKLGHKVKGSALSYGFKNIGTLGKALENFSEDEDYQKALECIQEIESIIENKMNKSTP